jgi:hypothetical protein
MYRREVQRIHLRLHRDRKVSCTVQMRSSESELVKEALQAIALRRICANIQIQSDLYRKCLTCARTVGFTGGRNIPLNELAIGDRLVFRSRCFGGFGIRLILEEQKVYIDRGWLAG